MSYIVVVSHYTEAKPEAALYQIENDLKKAKLSFGKREKLHYIFVIENSLLNKYGKDSILGKLNTLSRKNNGVIHDVIFCNKFIKTDQAVKFILRKSFELFEYGHVIGDIFNDFKIFGGVFIRACTVNNDTLCTLFKIREDYKWLIDLLKGVDYFYDIDKCRNDYPWILFEGNGINAYSLIEFLSLNNAVKYCDENYSPDHYRAESID